MPKLANLDILRRYEKKLAKTIERRDGFLRRLVSATNALVRQRNKETYFKRQIKDVTDAMERGEQFRQPRAAPKRKAHARVVELG